MSDTICAISTPMGVGGIAVIRISGIHAIKIVNSIFKGKDLEKVKSHTISYGHIIYKNEIIDEVLVSIMRAPKTFTKENVVEINLHGSIATTNKVLEILLLNGCRLAEPGEFTKRAFLNGRIDLVEAEAVSDLINSSSERARKASINELNGELSRIIKEVKEKILALEAAIEVNVDYPEYEDIENMTNSKVEKLLVEIIKIFEKLIEESNTGRIVKNGLNVALIGRPNTGKSSILNSLLDENKAIVSDIAGTTRDIVEGSIILNGFLINFIDTAGIRESSDYVEQIGVKKSKETIEKADLVILVLNNNEELSSDDKELLNLIKDREHIVFVNKSDLPGKLNIEGTMYVLGNTVNKDGLNKLKEKITEKLTNSVNDNDLTYMTNARQLALIKKANETIKKALDSCKSGIPVDFIEIDLKKVREYLNEITGEVYDDELINELFSKFCLGK